MKCNGYVAKIMLYAMAVLLVSCSKTSSVNTPPPLPSSPANIVDYSIEQQNAQVTILPVLKTINIQFSDSVISGNNMIADFKLSPGCTASVNNQVQKSGITKNDFSTNVVYTIIAADNSKTNWW